MCIEYYKSRILHTRNEQQQKWKKCLNLLVIFFLLFVHSLLSSIQNQKLWIIPSLIDYSMCVCVFVCVPTLVSSSLCFNAVSDWIFNSMHSIADSSQHIDPKKKNYEDDVKQVMQEQYVHSKLAINSGYFLPIIQNSSNQYTRDGRR